MDREKLEAIKREADNFSWASLGQPWRALSALVDALLATPAADQEQEWQPEWGEGEMPDIGLSDAAIELGAVELVQFAPKEFEDRTGGRIGVPNRMARLAARAVLTVVAQHAAPAAEPAAPPAGASAARTAADQWWDETTEGARDELSPYDVFLVGYEAALAARAAPQVTEAMVEALQFYADRMNWGVGKVHQSMTPCAAEWDGGQRARAALAARKAGAS